MEFLNPLNRKKDLIRLGVMKPRLSYKKGLKGTVLTLISMHETLKKFPQAYNIYLEVFGRVSSPLRIIRHLA